MTPVIWRHHWYEGNIDVETALNLNLIWITHDYLSKFILHSDIIKHEIYSIIIALA